MKTKINERKSVKVSSLGPITVVVAAAICLMWPSFSMIKIASNMLYETGLLAPPQLQRAATRLENIASQSFSPVDYMPVLANELESLADKPQFMLQVAQQVQADLESASGVNDLVFSSVFIVTSSQSGELSALTFDASSVSVVCQKVRQIRNDRGLILAEYWIDHLGPETKGHAVYYWSCYKT